MKFLIMFLLVGCARTVELTIPMPIVTPSPNEDPTILAPPGYHCTETRFETEIQYECVDAGGAECLIVVQNNGVQNL